MGDCLLELDGNLLTRHRSLGQEVADRLKGNAPHMAVLSVYMCMQCVNIRLHILKKCSFETFFTHATVILNLSRIGVVDTTCFHFPFIALAMNTTA